MLARLGVALRHRRPLRAAHALRHGRRDGGRHPAGRAAPRDDARSCASGRPRSSGQRGQTEAVLEEQVMAALAGLAADVVAGLVVAYEPIWAIGTGNAGHRGRRRGRLRASSAPWWPSWAGDEAAAGVRIQYGGSVNGRERRRPDGRARRGRAAGGRGQPARRPAFTRHHPGDRRLLPFLGRAGDVGRELEAPRCWQRFHADLGVHRHRGAGRASASSS